jgi:hypothetical protein
MSAIVHNGVQLSGQPDLEGIRCQMSAIVHNGVQLSGQPDLEPMGILKSVIVDDGPQLSGQPDFEGIRFQLTAIVHDGRQLSGQPDLEPVVRQMAATIHQEPCFSSKLNELPLEQLVQLLDYVSNAADVKTACEEWFLQQFGEQPLQAASCEEQLVGLWPLKYKSEISQHLLPVQNPPVVPFDFVEESCSDVQNLPIASLDFVEDSCGKTMSDIIPLIVSIIIVFSTDVNTMLLFLLII